MITFPIGTAMSACLRHFSRTYTAASLIKAYLTSSYPRLLDEWINTANKFIKSRFPIWNLS